MGGSPTTDLAERLAVPDAVLSRTDLAALGYGRRAIDRIFRALPTIELPGDADSPRARRPLIRAADFRAYIAEHTFQPGEERVR